MEKSPGAQLDSLDASTLAVAIVVSRYNSSITDRLLAGAREEFARLGGLERSLTVARVPGAFELPVACHAAASSERFDAVVALGCLIKGDTDHDRVIADGVAGALQRSAIETGTPVLFGVLTVDTMEQAEARAGGACGNKGAEAMAAAIETAIVIRSLKQSVG